jgi:hypothetical protein
LVDESVNSSHFGFSISDLRLEIGDWLECVYVQVADEGLGYWVSLIYI